MAKRKKSHPESKSRSSLLLGRSQAGLVQAALFFVLGFLFLWRFVEPRLMYHGGGEIQLFPTFFFGQEYLREQLREPGGLAKYVASFCAQFYYHNWTGALLLTAQAWLSFSFTRCILRAFGADRWSILGFVPPLLLLWLHARYTFCFPAVTQWLLGLSLGCLFCHWRMAQPWLRISLAMIAAAVLYLIAGSGFLVFSLLVTLFELQKQRWLSAAVFPLASAALPFLFGSWIFGLGAVEIPRLLVPFRWGIDATHRVDLMLFYGLFVFVPAVALAALVGHMVTMRFASRKTTGVAEEERELPASRITALRAAVELGCVVLALVAVWIWAPNRPLKAVLAVDYYATHRDWPRVLAAAQVHPFNDFIINAVDRALFHTGKLSEALPLFQQPEHLLLTGSDVRFHWNKVDLFLDLGCVNLALHHLSEALAFYGERPYLLRRLVLINLVLGNIDTAKIYLRALERTLFHAAWARDYLRRLDADPTLASDAEVTRLRGLQPVRDELVPLPPAQLLSVLLEANPRNAMACEYLLIYYLLSKNMKSYAAQFHRLQELGWSRLPALHDEALVLIHKQQKSPPDPAWPTPSPAALARFDQFAAAARKDGVVGRPAASLARTNSYFAYFFSQP